MVFLWFQQNAWGVQRNEWLHSGQNSSAVLHCVNPRLPVQRSATRSFSELVTMEFCSEHVRVSIGERFKGTYRQIARATFLGIFPLWIAFSINYSCLSNVELWYICFPHSARPLLSTWIYFLVSEFGKCPRQKAVVYIRCI